MSDIRDTEHPILLFDGVCNLCNASVQWVIKRDHKGIFRFAALQSDIGQQLLQQLGRSTTEFNSVVVMVGDKVYTESDAPLTVASRLGGIWQLARIFWLVPKPIRDALYQFVARNRYRWFGRTESCMMPQPGWKARFL
jgi:predicted DCC family thiol-disulfide oxidoreductase YuxK